MGVRYDNVGVCAGLCVSKNKAFPTPVGTMPQEDEVKVNTRKPTYFIH